MHWKASRPQSVRVREENIDGCECQRIKGPTVLSRIDYWALTEVSGATRANYYSLSCRFKVPVIELLP